MWREYEIYIISHWLRHVVLFFSFSLNLYRVFIFFFVPSSSLFLHHQSYIWLKSIKWISYYFFTPNSSAQAEQKHQFLLRAIYRMILSTLKYVFHVGLVALTMSSSSLSPRGTSFGWTNVFHLRICLINTVLLFKLFKKATIFGFRKTQRVPR